MDENLKTRILIVDDDTCFLRVLKRILSGEQYAVTTTSDPSDAVGILRSSTFNLVICDLHMPGCDGLTLLQNIRKEGIDVPLIILTAYGEVETYLEAMNAGAAEYLNKPIKTDEFLETIRSILRRGNHRCAVAPPENA